jgi:hypothetical protein
VSAAILRGGCHGCGDLYVHLVNGLCDMCEDEHLRDVLGCTWCDGYGCLECEPEDDE